MCNISAERKKIIDFSDMYCATPSILIGEKTGDKNINPEHLKGKVIAVQGATVNERYAQKYFGAAGVEIKTYPTVVETTAALTAGNVNYVQGDPFALDAFLRTDEGKKCCELKGTLPHDYEIFGIGVGAGVRKGETALKEKLNSAIATLAKQKKFSEITKNYPELQGALSTPEK